MLSPAAVSALQLGHVIVNSFLFLGFAFQGRLGWKVRRTRIAGGAQDFHAVKQHRKLGPILAALLTVGYLAGLITVYLHKSRWLTFPLHFAVGTALLAVAFSAFVVSKKIRGQQSNWRTPHAALGLFLLGLFLVQILIGLDIFL